MHADTAHKPLGNDPRERRCEQIGRRPHLDHAKNRGDTILRMERREQRVPREGNTHRHLRRLTVADLAQKDLLDILPQCCPQSRDKGQPRLRTYGKLTDSINTSFHGIFERHNVTVWVIELGKCRIERRRLARVHRSTDKEEPRRSMDESFKNRFVFRRETKLPAVKESLRPIHNAHNHALTAHDGKNRHAHIDAALPMWIANLPILWTVALCRVDARHHL